MSFLKKDQSRSEVILITGFIILALIVIVRFLGPVFLDFFFGASNDIKIIGTKREQELTGSNINIATPTPPVAKSDEGITIDNVDKSLYGNEEAIAQLRYKKEQKKKDKIKKEIFKALAWLSLLVVITLIGWKTYTIIKEIKVKNLE